MSDCKHETTFLRKKTTSNGSLQAVRQCITCGATTAGPIKHYEVTVQAGCDVSELKEFDRGIAEQWFELVRKKRMEEFARGRLKRQSDYQELLSTPSWKQKRDAVMRRDGGICQGCMVNPATEVHHLTYEHRGNELLFELVAVCSECHARIHDA